MDTTPLYDFSSTVDRLADEVRYLLNVKHSLTMSMFMGTPEFIPEELKKAYTQLNSIRSKVEEAFKELGDFEDYRHKEAHGLV